MWKLPGWQRARIERWAAAAAVTFADKSDTELSETRELCKRELRTGPQLAAEVDLWAARHWRGAARQVAAGNAGLGAQETASSQLALWRGVLLDETAERIVETAGAWSQSLPNGRENRERITRDLERANAFGILDKAVRRWAEVNRRPLTELVAIENEMTLRRQLARIDRPATPAGIKEALTAAAPTTDEIASGLQHDIGRARLELLLQHSRAIRPHVEGRPATRLLAWRALLGRPFDELSVEAARAGLRLEQEWRDAARAMAVAEARGRIVDTEHRQTYVDAWKVATARMRSLEQEGVKQWIEGTHVDGWWLTHELAAATQLAINDALHERGLARRHTGRATDHGEGVEQELR